MSASQPSASDIVLDSPFFEILDDLTDLPIAPIIRICGGIGFEPHQQRAEGNQFEDLPKLQVDRFSRCCRKDTGSSSVEVSGYCELALLSFFEKNNVRIQFLGLKWSTCLRRALFDVTARTSAFRLSGFIRRRCILPMPPPLAMPFHHLGRLVCRWPGRHGMYTDRRADFDTSSLYVVRRKAMARSAVAGFWGGRWRRRPSGSCW